MNRKFKLALVDYRIEGGVMVCVCDKVTMKCVVGRGDKYDV
jgi:hypothetical protein